MKKIYLITHSVFLVFLTAITLQAQIPRCPVTSFDSYPLKKYSLLKTESLGIEMPVLRTQLTFNKKSVVLI